MEHYETEKLSYFEQALDRIRDMHRKKAHDYTDNGEFDNFIESAQAAGIETYQAIENLIATKEARIRVIRRNMKSGKDVSNEPLLDSYLDRAVYALISYAHELMVEETKDKARRSNPMANDYKNPIEQSFNELKGATPPRSSYTK